MNKQILNELTSEIQSAYEQGVTLEHAERLASKFLHAQLSLSEALKAADLDARMKKSGNKAVRAGAYLEEATKGDKKPSDTFIEAHVNTKEAVIEQQLALDEAEVALDELKRYYDIFHEAHVHFRGIAKGRFGD